MVTESNTHLHTQNWLQERPWVSQPVLIYLVSFTSQTRTWNVYSLVLPRRRESKCNSCAAPIKFRISHMVFCFLLLVCLNVIYITKIICKQGVQNSFPPSTSFNETKLHVNPKLDLIVFSGISQKPSLSHPFILSVPLGIRNAIAQLLRRQLFLQFIHSGWKQEIWHLPWKPVIMRFPV